MSILGRAAVFASVLVAANAANPVTKVIKLLEDLKSEVEDDGKKEAKSYGKFACFCKDTTKDKSTSIIDGEDAIGKLSGNIADDTASKEEKETEVQERKAKHEEMGTDLGSTVARCMTSQAQYEAGNADMTKAIESLNKAIKAMKAKKGAIGFIQTMDEDVQRGLAMAGLDPSDPAYKYHSKEINEILAKLLTDFKDEKQAGVDKWDITQKACNKEKDSLNKKMKDNLDAKVRAEEKIENLKKKIAKDRGDLVKAQEQLQEDEVYLKDLTAQCEAKAHDYDQRSSMRGDEIEALSQAIKIIGNKVKGADKEVNRAALVQKPLSFLQKYEDVSPAMQERIVSLLRLEGSRLGSAELSLAAMQINGPDHFKKVTSIIQSLIEKLLDEAKAEASKKGWCDMEIAKGETDRDHAQDEAQTLSTELKDLEATKEELEAELKQLAKDIKKAEAALVKAKDLRQEEKEDNEAILEKANAGLEALNEAILVLKSFYSSASRARVLLQGSPVDADTAGAGFGGAYKGKQKSSRAIFTLLETIQGDFEHTISETEQAEADSHAEFVKFDRASQEDIASKETKTTLDKQDLKSTNTNIEKSLDDLETEMGLQHDALKMIASLKPACLDAGGMSFKQRTAKRNEEVAALEKAICILTPGKKEGDCK